MDRVPERIGVAGDWHGNTAWAVRAVRKMTALLPADRPRVIVHLGDYQRRVDLGGGPIEVTGLDCDGADHGNWAILDVTSMRWLRFAGRPISNALRGLVSR
jgi:hypothetical protein